MLVLIGTALQASAILNLTNCLLGRPLNSNYITDLLPYKSYAYRNYLTSPSPLIQSKMLYILLLIVPALGLTDDEIAMFSPDHYPDHIERNTGT